MRGVFRRPFLAVAAGSFLIVAGTFMGARNLEIGYPRYLIVAALMVLAGIGMAGFFPADRDLDERDAQTWQRWSPYLLFGSILVLFAELSLPIPDPFATFVIVAVGVEFVGGHVWFITRGRPMTDALIEEEMAKTGMTPALALVSAKPGFFGKAGRVLVFGGACAVAGLLVIGTIALARDRVEPRRPARWLELPVHYCTDTHLDGYIDDAQFVESAALAFERWGVPAVHDGACPAFVQNDDGVSAIGWRPLHGDSDGGTYRIAACKYFCRGDMRLAIGESDVYLKPFMEEEYATVECFDALMLHEVGHFLGLNHNDGYGVMGDGEWCSSEFSSEDLASLFERYGEDADPQYATLTGSQ
jgi:hypothetical protein